MVSEWMVKGNAYQYVQDQSVDPRPLVSRDSSMTVRDICENL